MGEKKIRVSIYEDNHALRKSLAALIGSDSELELAGAFANPVNIVEETKEHFPDVMIMDIGMPGMSGIEAVALVKKHFPEIKVVMQTVFDDEQNIFHSVCAGAVGYLLKNTPPQQILDSLKLAAQGGAPMTPVIATKVLTLFRQYHAPASADVDLSTREKEILSSLAKGSSYKMIAAEHSISIDTVRFHIKNIYEKLHVHSMTEAVSRALREKLI
ncbi:MAG TPA: response regulator transcription factor [Bacteroidia bacterium]|jgi:DNA-binding NarL/FixJ family response regulator